MICDMFMDHVDTSVMWQLTVRFLTDMSRVMRSSFRLALTNRQWRWFVPTDEESSCWTQLISLWLCECTCTSVPRVSWYSDSILDKTKTSWTITTSHIKFHRLCSLVQRGNNLQNLNYSVCWFWAFLSLSSDHIQSILLRLQLVPVCSEVSYGEGLSGASLPLRSDWCYHGKTGSH